MKKKSQPDLKLESGTALLIGCYSRVSTDEQANVIEGSLDNQRHRMQSFIDVKNMQEPNWGHLVEYFVDDGYSAKDTNRPAYARMMKALKCGKINAVMVTELSRLSRNIPDFCDFHKMLESQGAKFFSIKEQFDSSTPAGKMMLYNMINLAQFEREQTSERVAINCHSRAQRGLLNGGPAILGYDKDPAKKATFLVNDQEAKDVRRIFELFIEQRSLSRTIDAVAAENIKPKVRENEKNRLVKAGRWTVESLSFVLKNKAYIAVRDVNKVSKNKDQSKLKAWQKYGSYPASWPAIVDEVTFNTANVILAENFERERMRLDTSATRVFAASGICVCEECGRKLVGQSAHGKIQVHRYYVHSSKRGDVIKCSVKRVKADKIELKLAEYLSDILLEAGHFDQIEERIKQLAAHSPEQLKADKNRISLELQKLTLAVKNTFKIQAALDAESEAIRETAKELEELSRKKRHLEAELESLKSKEIEKGDVDDAINDLKGRLGSFRKGWIKASAVMKKSLLKDLVYFVLVGPKGLKIQFRLKHDLNKDVTPEELTAAKISENNVIDLSEKRQKKSEEASATSESKNSDNLAIPGSQVVGIGRPGSGTYNDGPDHDFIELFQNSKHRIFSIAAPLYREGHSLNEISAMTGIPYSTLNDELKKNKMQLRPNKSVSPSVVFRQKFKSSTPPPYGFTYMGGQLEKHAREYPTLLVIHRQWQLGQSATAIANHLNSKKLKSRSQKTWSRNVILNIIERLENKTVVIERG